MYSEGYNICYKMTKYIAINKKRYDEIVEAYFKWKSLNDLIKSYGSRGVNFPELISESALCYALNFQLIRESKGDAFDFSNNQIIEVKATSNYDRDTTSFSPKSPFDVLYFMRLDVQQDILYIYNTNCNSEDLKKIDVNENDTFGDHQEQSRRPRFSVIDKIIKKNNLNPIGHIDFKTKKVTIY